jgi:hypothetical protein
VRPGPVRGERAAKKEGSRAWSARWSRGDRAGRRRGGLARARRGAHEGAGDFRRALPEKPDAGRGPDGRKSHRLAATPRPASSSPPIFPLSPRRETPAAEVLTALGSAGGKPGAPTGLLFGTGPLSPLLDTAPPGTSALSGTAPPASPSSSFRAGPIGRAAALEVPPPTPRPAGRCAPGTVTTLNRGRGSPLTRRGSKAAIAADGLAWGESPSAADRG